MMKKRNVLLNFYGMNEPDPPIAPAPKYRKLVTETVEVKHQSGIDRADGKKNDGSAKKNMDPRAAKKKRGKKTYS